MQPMPPKVQGTYAGPQPGLDLVKVIEKITRCRWNDH